MRKRKLDATEKSMLRWMFRNNHKEWWYCQSAILVICSITFATYAYLMMSCGNSKSFYSLSPRVNSDVPEKLEASLVVSNV